MMMHGDVSCVCCSKPLPRAEDRRKLGGPSYKQELQTFRQFVGKSGASSCLPSNITTKCRLYWCKPCHARLVKYNSMTEAAKRLDAEITCSIQSVAAATQASSLVPNTPTSSPSLDVPCRPQKRSLPCTEESPSKYRRLPSTSTPTRKRSAESSADHTPPRRRRLISTIERQTLAKTVVTGTPAVTVLVKRKKGSSVYPITRSLKKIGKSLGRSNRKGIARQVVRDVRIRKYLVKYLGRHASQEMKALCSLDVSSVLRNKTLQEFNSKLVIEEMERHAPSVLAILRGCLAGCRASKTVTSKSKRFDVDQVVAVCSAILLRGRSQRMNLLQRIISLVLYNGHASKRVYSRLQKLCLSLSNRATIKCIDKFGMNYDKPVLEWKNKIINVMQKDQSVLEEEQQLPEQEANLGGTREEEKIASPPSMHSSSDSDSSTSYTSHQNDISPEESSPSPPSFSSVESNSSSALSDYYFSFSDVFGFETSVAPTLLSLPTFKIVGDNIDKNIRPRYMTLDNQAKSLHYFHIYGVRDRIDLSNYSDDLPPIIDAVDFDVILPSKEDEVDIRHNFSILIARVLKKYMPYFKRFGNGLERHIRHEYYEEMSRKSEVVPLGIILKSEISHADMVSILEDLHHQYVPFISSTKHKSVFIDDKEEVSCVYEDTFHRVLLGGDQLTAARVRGAQRVRANSERPLDRLEGVEAVCEDWHAKGVLLAVAWKCLYSTMSGADAGTLYQLRNLINRRNVVKDPTKDVSACEDFFLLLTEAHILTAAMTLFSMKSLEDTPVHEVLCSDTADSLQRRNSLIKAASLIVEKFVDVSYGQKAEESEPQKRGPRRSTRDHDGVLAYASEVLNHGLMLMEFMDSVKEGDGNRIIRCWKYFLLLFKANKRKNYSIEALTLLLQYYFILSPRMAAQLKWNRTINVHEKPGKNVSSDLHMEHLNRTCKTALSGMGSNINDESVTRVGRAIKILNDSMHSFDKLHGVPDESGAHSKRSNEKDMQKILKLIFEDVKVFLHVPGRQHSNYPAFTPNSMKKITTKKLTVWLEKKSSSILSMYR